MAHNPKWNPCPGDILTKGMANGQLLERAVQSASEGQQLTFTVKGKLYKTTLKRWRDWAVDAKIAS